MIRYLDGLPPGRFDTKAIRYLPAGHFATCVQICNLPFGGEMSWEVVKHSGSEAGHTVGGVRVE